VIAEPGEAGFVDVLTVGKQVLGCVGVVVAVAVAGAADPAVVELVGVEVAEGVDEAVAVGQGAVEVVFERLEDRVAGLVAGFEDRPSCGRTRSGSHR
jgi:hypothetical protein